MTGRAVTRPPWGTASPEEMARWYGFQPYALGRAIELQAAFELMSRFHPAVTDEDRRVWLAGYSRRALHGFIGAYLKRHPERTVLA